MNRKRYSVLDGIRGLALLNMVIYHCIWDLIYIYGVDWQWYRSKSAYIWQQWICWTFILVSGFCYSFGRQKLRRGSITFLLGATVSVVTRIAMPENCVRFGILTLIGSCTLLLCFAERLLQKVNSALGFVGSLFLFLFARNVNRGYIGFEAWNVVKLPEAWYCNLLTAYLGFPADNFFSTDYFPLFPWLFLFLMGYFANRLCRERELLGYLEKHKMWMLDWLGKHSLKIYIVHQPILYLVLSFVFKSYGK